MRHTQNMDYAVARQCAQAAASIKKKKKKSDVIIAHELWRLPPLDPLSCTPILG